MSGGVDSSAAAMLLQQQGYDVTGATLRMFSNEDLGLTAPVSSIITKALQSILMILKCNSQVFKQ